MGEILTGDNDAAEKAAEQQQALMKKQLAQEAKQKRQKQNERRRLDRERIDALRGTRSGGGFGSDAESEGTSLFDMLTGKS